MQNYRLSRQGFTLVELSIVLVVIGLLIGGILIGQSLIGSANLNATVRQISQFDAGVMNFKTRYNFLPGDAPAFGGDGDGAIEVGVVYGYDDALVAFGCEIANFWNNTFPDQFSGATCQGPFTQRVISGANKNVPESKIGSSNSFFIASAISGDGQRADKVNLRNYYAILESEQVSAILGGSYQFATTETSQSNSALKPAEMLALDKKMDDAVADSGNIISGRIPNVGGVGGITEGGVIACNSAGAYQIQINTYECTPLIRIGSIAGNPL